MLVKLQSLDEKRERETAIKICLRVFRNQKEFVKWPLTKPAKRNNVIIAENSFAYEVFYVPYIAVFVYDARIHVWEQIGRSIDFI